MLYGAAGLSWGFVAYKSWVQLICGISYQIWSLYINSISIQKWTACNALRVLLCNCVLHNDAYNLLWYSLTP